jgi:hypothetical protein
MQDTIDASQWLNQSFHKAYPHAAARTVEHNGRYKSTDSMLFDNLYELGVLDASQLSAAEFLVTLNSVATNKTGYARLLSIVQDQQGGNKIPGFCPSTLMKLIISNMGKRQWSQVERICIKEVRSSDMGWILQCKGSIQESFDELGKSIEISVDILKARLQNGENYEGVTAPKFSPAV